MRRIIHRNITTLVAPPERTPPIFRDIVESVTHVVKVFSAAVNKLPERLFCCFLTTEDGLRTEITRFTIHVNHSGSFNCSDKGFAFIQRCRGRDSGIDVFTCFHRLNCCGACIQCWVMITRASKSDLQMSSRLE